MPKIFEKMIAPLVWSVSAMMQREMRSGQEKLIAAIRHENRIALALQRFYRLDDATIHFEHNGCPVSLHVPDADLDFLQQDIVIWKRFFESEWLEYIRATYDLSGATVADVGANIGNHTVFFSKVCGAGRCLAVEPSPSLARILEHNIELNDLDSVEVHRCGLSDRTDPLFFRQQPSDNLGHTSFSHEGYGISVPSSRLDDLGLERLDFIKIDVEGMAAHVLRGARKTLVRCRPVIMIELFPEDSAEAERELTSLGYQRIHTFNPENFLYAPKGGAAARLR